MKAAILREPNRPLSMESVAVPSIKDDEVLMKVKAVGICQSDVRMWHGNEIDKLPLILGHECSGIVERVGAKVKSLKPDDRILMDYRITCGDCYYCSSGKSNLCDFATDIGANIDGGYAEYVAMPSRQAFPLPPEISFEEGAIIGCAVVTAYHAAKQVAKIHCDDTVAIIGTGGVGYHILKFAKAFGAKKTIAVDIDEKKLDRAARLGAEVINPGNEPVNKLIMDHTGNEGVDVAFEAIGSPRTVEAAVRSVTKNGRVILVGICSQEIKLAPWQDMMYNPRVHNSGKEIQIKPSIDHLRTDITDVIAMVKDQRVKLSDSITHKIPLSKANEGLEMMDKKLGNPIRIVMLPEAI